jgi:hypothetical protein
MLAKVIKDGKYRNVLGTTKKEIMEMVKKMVKVYLQIYLLIE